MLGIVAIKAKAGNKTRNPLLLNEATCSQIYSKESSFGSLTPFRIKTLMKCSASFGPKTSGFLFGDKKY